MESFLTLEWTVFLSTNILFFNQVWWVCSGGCRTQNIIEHSMYWVEQMIVCHVSLDNHDASIHYISSCTFQNVSPHWLDPNVCITLLLVVCSSTYEHAREHRWKTAYCTWKWRQGLIIFTTRVWFFMICFSPQVVWNRFMGFAHTSLAMIFPRI